MAVVDIDNWLGEIIFGIAGVARRAHWLERLPDAEANPEGVIFICWDAASAADIEVAFGIAGLLNFIAGAGVEGHGFRAREVEASILKMVVDEDGDGDEAAGGGFAFGADPLNDADGADGRRRWFLLTGARDRVLRWQGDGGEQAECQCSIAPR